MSNIAIPWKNIDPNLHNPVRNTKSEYLKFLNTVVFSEEARHFLRNGYYTNAPYGSKDYNDYWDEQEKRCLEGYSVGGVRITGRHYYYLNFTLMKARPIDPNTGIEHIEGKKELTFPRFLDHQYYLFNEIEECMAEGPHIGKDRYGLVILKSRRKGLTYCISNGLYGYNFTFIPASTNILGAYEKQHYKVTLDGIHFGLNHINKHTDWAKRRQKLNKRDHFRASFMYKDSNGVEIEDGYMSEVMALSFKDNEFKSVGDCFKPNQMILNSLGESVRIDSIKVGDYVMGIDGSPRKVLNVHSGTDLMTTYSQRKGTEFTVNTNHLIYGIRKAQSFGKLYDKEIKIKSKDLLKKSKNYIKSIRTLKPKNLNLGNEDLGIDPYFYGLWLGDGDSRASQICTADPEIVNYLTNLSIKYGLTLRKDFIAENNRAFSYHLGGVKGNSNLITLKHKDRIKVYSTYEEVAKDIGLTRYSWSFLIANPNSERSIKTFERLGVELIKLEKENGNPFKKWLTDNNLLANKHVINKVKYLNKEDKLKFLAGLIDTDGSINGTKRIYSISQKSRKFLEDVAFIGRSLGFYCTVNTYKRISGFGKILNDYSKLSISGDIWEIPVLIERKKAVPFKHEVPVLESSIKVANQYHGEYVGIEVDGDHLFLLDDFTIVHNSASLFGIEEAGKFNNLITTYPISIEPLVRDGDVTTGFPIIYGSAGDMEGGSIGLAEMFYNPKAYGLKSYENIYDENATGDCGYFIDDLWYLPGKYKKPVSINGKKVEKSFDMVDKEGNSIRDVALESLTEKRVLRKKGNKDAYLKFLSQQPLNPREALLRTQGNMFDAVRAQFRLSQIETNPAIYIDSIYRCNLTVVPDTGEIKMEINNNIQPVYEFPIKDNKNKPGIIEIYELPVKNIEGKVPYGLNIFAVDSFDDDASTTDSMGSMLVFNRLTQRIVAHYKGRPMANQFYENCRRLAKFYNARGVYERRNKGIYGYFLNTGSLHLLAEEPEILREKGISKANTLGNNSLGIAPSTSVNAYGRELALKWMSSLAYNEEPNSEITNLDKIRSIPLLKEIIAWNSDGNFDDISALGLLMIYAEDRSVIKVDPDRKLEVKSTNNFWDKLNTNKYNKKDYSFTYN